MYSSSSDKFNSSIFSKHGKEYLCGMKPRPFCLFWTLLLFFFFNFPFTKAQHVPQLVNSTSIYEFLDEMANAGHIELLSAIKPYSREFIYQKLSSINKEKLNKRQQQELDFYMLDFIKENPGYRSVDFLLKGVGQTSLSLKNRDKRYDLFFYKDSIFTASINPIFGGTAWYNQNGLNFHRFSGGHFFARAGKFGMYGLMVDQYEEKLISDSAYLTQMQGAFYKKSSKLGAADYSDSRGGITYSNKWITAGIMKETFVWGDNYNGANIYSGRNPSFPYLMLKVHPASWFEFNYIHGWMSSNVIDSVRSRFYPQGEHILYIRKFIAANMFSFKPFKRTYLSFGNSMVYDDKFYPGYLIPFIYFKSLDHNSSRNGNAQLFFNLSTRQVRNNHIYVTWFIDEMSLRRMFNSNIHTNWWSIKAGWRWSNFLPNLSFTAEYTRSNPMVYKHYIPTTTLESTGFNLGHYLRDNSQETYLSLDWKPIQRLKARASVVFASKGPDYADNRVEVDSITGKLKILGLPFQEKTIWQYNAYSVNLQYEWVNDLWVELGYQYRDIKDENDAYTPDYFKNKTQSLLFGLRIGF